VRDGDENEDPILKRRKKKKKKKKKQENMERDLLLNVPIHFHKDFFF